MFQASSIWPDGVRLQDRLHPWITQVLALNRDDLVSVSIDGCRSMSLATALENVEGLFHGFEQGDGASLVNVSM